MTDTMNTEKCEKFLCWFEDNQGEKHIEIFKSLLKTAKEARVDSFLSALKVTCNRLKEAESNPLLRLTWSHESSVQIGMLLGYCLALASTDPTFDALLEEINKDPGNVTPLSASKLFGKKQ